MIPIIIDSIDDKRVDVYRNIKSTRSSLLAQNLTIGESEIVLQQALLAKSRINKIILSQEYYEIYKNQIPEGTEVLISSPEIIRNLAKYNLRNPILFIVEWKNVAISSDSNNYLFLNAINNFENVGAIIRNAVAFGFESIIYDSSTCNPFHHRSVVVSRGSVFHTNISKAETKDFESLSILKSQGYKIVALEISDSSEDIQKIAAQIHKNDKYVLVLGSEGAGVDRRILNISDYIAHIPMNTDINSINVAASSAIGMYLFSERINL